MINKFRVWDNITKKYVEHDTVFVINNCGNLARYEQNRCIAHINAESPYILTLCSNRYSAEFNSGMLDKNGREIYTRDIIKFMNYEWEVQYSNSRYAFIIVDNKDVKLFMHDLKYLDEFKDIEVIGNIHNKEIDKEIDNEHN